MDNRLIFRYRRERAKAEAVMQKGYAASRGCKELAQAAEASDVGTQEGR